MTGKEIDNIFKEKLYSYHEKPSENLWDRIDMQLEKPSFWDKFKIKIVTSVVVVSSICLINNPLNENEYRYISENIQTISGIEIVSEKGKAVLEESYNIQLQTEKTSLKTVDNESFEESFVPAKGNLKVSNHSLGTKIKKKINAEMAPELSLMQPVEITNMKKAKKKFSVSITINLKEGAFKNRQSSPENDRSRVGHFLQQINNFRHGRKVDFKRVKKDN